ncbi:uncharacterized protein LOC144907224 [Branchiostoma floridae x Branchiostoma belcheri]
METNDKRAHASVFVVRGASGNLLSYETAEKLGLVKACADVNVTVADNIQELVKEYDDVFQGIGKLKDFQVKLHVDPFVVPVKQPHRRIPFHVRKQVENELKKLEEEGIIEEVSGPTPWVSPIVVAPNPSHRRKSGSVST